MAKVLATFVASFIHTVIIPITVLAGSLEMCRPKVNSMSRKLDWLCTQHM